MTTPAQARTLEAMGIEVWVERSDAPVLHIKNPKAGMPCWILLSEPLLPGDELETVFINMVKVLNLTADEYCVAFLNPALPINVDNIVQILKQWFPETVLVMGSELGQALANVSEILQIPLQITYHPNELKVAKDKKRQAYQDLLAVKERLEDKLKDYDYSA